MTVLWFVLLAAAVSLIGIMLARTSDRLGEAFRLERSITGFLLLAAATSLPELVISCQVARTGALDMASGSLLGSCLMNMMILAVIDLSRRNRGTMLSGKAAAHGLSGLASMMMAGIVAVAVLVPNAPTYKGMHLASGILFVAYIATFRLIYLDRQISRMADSDESKPTFTPHERSKRVKWRAMLPYLLATTGIFVLASPLARSSGNLAVYLGLSGTFFGAVFLAFVTSLPELVTTHEASRMNAEDMAIGNILGSNAFNLLILVAIDVITPEPLFSTLGSIHAVAAIGVVITTSIAVMGMLYRVETRWWTLEPDAVAVIGVSLFFFYLIYTG